MKSKSLKQELIYYISLKDEFEKKGGPSADAEMFEAVLELEEKILKQFALPITLSNSKILREIFDESEIENAIWVLELRAKKYLLSTPKSELEILADAQNKKLDAFDVLPEIGLSTNSYNTFVYENILLKKKATPKQVLDELIYFQKKKLLKLLVALEKSESMGKLFHYESLKKGHKLMFIDAYLDVTNNEEEHQNKSKKETKISDFYLLDVTLLNSNNFWLLCHDFVNNKAYVVFATNAQAAQILCYNQALSNK